MHKPKQYLGNINTLEVHNTSNEDTRCRLNEIHVDHRRWYDQQRPPLFAEALRSAKATLDPHATLNPGVLIDP